MNHDEIRALTGRARFGRKTGASSQDGMVVSSHPVVTRVGVDVLRAGGNATDAMLAASVAQTVVEPHMSTICGMLSALSFHADDGSVTYVSGGPGAPAEPLGPRFDPADMATGRGVAVPGFWAAWEASYERYATLSRDRLLAPAIELAEQGFPVYPFLWGMLFEQASSAGRHESGREIWFPHGRLIDVGEVLRQPRLAETLARLADKGSDYFYRGPWASKFVDVVRGAGGVITEDDMDAYEARWLEPARSTYRDLDVVASPPPDNGGTHVIEILNLVEQLPLHEWGPATQSPDTLYWLARFCAEVFADGHKHGDPAHFPMPLELFTSKHYAQQRFELMRMAEPLDRAPEKQALPGSNHLTVMDREGNVVTTLHSVMAMPWSNGLHVDGVQVWAGAGHFARRMPKPRGRATCYIAPNMLLRDGKPVLASGSPSISLMQNVVQNTLNIVDFGMDVETSVHLPRFGGLSLAAMNMQSTSQAIMMEADLGTSLLDDVRRRGLAIDVCSPWYAHLGSFEGIAVDANGTMTACADPRRAGAAEGV